MALRRLLLSLLSRGARRREARRAEIAARPFPAEWEPHLRRAVPLARYWPDDVRARHRGLVQVFLAEKTITGCDGLVADDEVRVIIAAAACVLLAGGPPLDVFPLAREILVYPVDLVRTVEAIAPDGRPWNIRDVRMGEAWRRGPVRFSWKSVIQSVTAPADGYNVVYHEFAHVIDMQNGDADGTPPLPAGVAPGRWEAVIARECAALYEAERAGRRTVLDPYGGQSPAEFFAVASETFFEQPRVMARYHPDVYDLLRALYCVDPARWPMPWV